MTTTRYSDAELAQALRARTDFEFYCRFVHQVSLAPHHLEWVGIFQSRKIEDRMVAITAPPESWKSRVLRMYIEWSIGIRPEWCRIWAMNTETQIKDQIRSVQDTIENNERYHLVFPHVKPDYKRGWNRTTIFIERENSARPDPTVLGCGVQGPIQGVHVEEIFLDDITDQQDVNSPTTMRSQRQWVRGVLKDRLIEENDVPVGGWYAIFTRWGDQDLWPLFTAPRNPDDVDGGMGFKGVAYPAISGTAARIQPYPWGELLWPDNLSFSRLESIRSIKGTALYTLTYLCDPTALKGDVFEIEKLNRYSLSDPPPFRLKIHSWDCASGDSADASYSVCIELAVSDQGIFVTWVFRQRMRHTALKNAIFNFRDDRHPNLVLIEDRGPGEAMIGDILSNDEDRKLPELREVDPMGDGDKLMRAQGQTSVIETGRLWVPTHAPWLSDFMAELAAFPHGRFNDQVDALTQGLQYLRGNSVAPPSHPVSWMGGTRPESVYDSDRFKTKVPSRW